MVLAVRWCLRFGLSYRDLEELLAERGIQVDHVTIGTVALSRNVPGKPSNVEALLRGRAPRRGRTTRPCHDLSSLSGEVEAVAWVIAQATVPFGSP
jgi:hypothetical protein